MSTPEDDDLPDNVIRIDFRARRVQAAEPPVAEAPVAAPAKKTRRTKADSAASGTKADPAAKKTRRKKTDSSEETASAKDAATNTAAKTSKRATGTRRAATTTTATPPAEAKPALPDNVTAFPAELVAPTPVEVSFRVELDPSEADSYNERRFEYFDRVIQQGMVSVTFDPRRPGVSVPPAFASRPELMLNFSLRFNIADFEWDRVGVRASLSFDDGPFFCDIPWTAIWLMVSRPTYSAYAIPLDAPPERRGTIPGMLRSVRSMLEQLPPPR